MVNVAAMSLTDRFLFAVDKAPLGKELRQALAGLLTAATAAIAVGVLVAWIASHSIAVGQIIDGLLLGMGVAFMGVAVFEGMNHLGQFAAGIIRANTEAELTTAGEHFAKAVAILGPSAILALLTRSPKTLQRNPERLIAPPKTQKPIVIRDPNLRAGEGYTMRWGDIVISAKGTAKQQAKVLSHEEVHQFLTPKLNFLRAFRVTLKENAYNNSSLWRYLEECIAEGRALIKHEDIGEALTAVGFPVRNGYVHLIREGGQVVVNGEVRIFQGGGVLPELGLLIVHGLILGKVYYLYFQSEAAAVETLTCEPDPQVCE